MLAPDAKATPDSEPTSVVVNAGGVELFGDLAIPGRARGLVVFAHGSGSGRLSPRNRFVAHELQRGGLATLLLDLLTPDEELVDESTRHLRFDIGLLAGRLGHAVRWAAARPSTSHLAIGCFGASTGAAAALGVAANIPEGVRAVVSRGGRPDLAGPKLLGVVAPTLLIVGGNDGAVVDLNELALRQLGGHKELKIIPGATHLFSESGALEHVAMLARDWFLRYLPHSGTVDADA